MEARQMMLESKNTIRDNSLAKMLMNKWSDLLEGIEDHWTRRSTAFLFENEMQHLRELFEDSTYAVNIPDYVRFLFPVIRRVFPSLIANKLLSIQPMTGPVGGIFNLEYKYGTTKGTITKGNNMIEDFDRFYTSEYIYEEVIGTGDGGTPDFAGTLTWSPLKPASSSQIGIEFLTVVGGVDKRIYDADGSGTLSGDTGAASNITSYENGDYDITFDGNVDNGEPVYANYYYNMEAVADNVPEMYMDIQLTEVKAQSRKLKALWSSEAADDMKAMIGMDVEGELVSGIASEVNLEIDRELIMDMYGANTTNISTFDATVPPDITQVDHYRGLLTELDKLSQEINRRTKRGPANWIVCGTAIATMLGQLESKNDFKSVFAPAPADPGLGTTGRPGFPLPGGQTGYGIYQLGVLQNRWVVYVDPYFPTNKALVGLKGTTFLDAGMVFAPYVPLQVTQTFLDPGNFQARKGIRRRYAKKLVNTNFYGRLTVSNAP